MFASVRGARIILADDAGIRAGMTASWLAQMNWDVYVLDEDVSKLGSESGPWKPRRPALPVSPTLSTAELNGLLDRGSVVVIDLSSSANYSKGHIPGAWFALRSTLADALAKIPRHDLTVLTSEDGVLAQYAAADLQKMGIAARALQGGNASWMASEFALETEPVRFASPTIDRYKRPYEGADNPASAMQAYLDWEYGLVAQLERDGTHGFRVV
jgi:rhodanese-related sulfurtransferase